MIRSQPLIAFVNPSKAIHSPNGVGEVFVTLINRTASAFAGSVSLALTDRGLLVGTETKPVSSLAVGASLTIGFGLTTGARDFTGYLVDVSVRDGFGAVVDQAPGSFDVSSSPYRFPRECFLTDMSGALNPVSTIQSVNLWGCNVMQLYDCFYKAHIPAPPSNLSSWPNLASKTVQRTTLNDFLGTARSYNMASFLFQDWYMAYEGYEYDGSGLRLDWALFNRPFSPNTPYTLADQHRFGDFSGFGWQSSTLYVFNPSDPRQRDQWTRAMRDFYTQFPLCDGVQIDTVGAAVDVGGSGFDQRWDARGRKVTTGDHIADWTNSAITGTGRPGVINQVSMFGGSDVHVRARQSFIYAELWHYDVATHSGFNFHLGNIRKVSTKPVCIPSYVNELKRDSCSLTPNDPSCTLNETSALLIDAAIAASGGYHVKVINGSSYASTVFVPGYTLPIAPQTGRRLLDYQAFQVGYQNILRDGIADAPEPVSITSGAVGSPSGGPGTVWLMPKTKAGYHILHLMNHMALPAGIAPQDRNAVFTRPSQIGAFTVKMHYWGNINPGVSRLMIATPDRDNAKSISLSYTSGSDTIGNFITFTVPRLDLWSVVYLETLGSVGLYEAVAAQPIRGVHFDVAAPGIGSGSDGLPLGMGFGRWARYPSIQFGSGVSKVLCRVQALKSTMIEVRLDDPHGFLLGVVRVPETGTQFVEVSAALYGANGTARVVLVFPDRLVRLSQFAFVV